MTNVIKRHFHLLLYLQSSNNANLKRMFSNSSKYAIKALAYIVNYSSYENKLLVKEIATKIEVPKPFLSKILQQLSSKDYLSSAKGRKGGFYITEKQLNNSILDIIIETEGKDRLKECVLNFDNCNTLNPCPVHDLIAASKDSLRQSFETTKLEDLREN